MKSQNTDTKNALIHQGVIVATPLVMKTKTFQLRQAGIEASTVGLDRRPGRPIRQGLAEAVMQPGVHRVWLARIPAQSTGSCPLPC